MSNETTLFQVTIPPVNTVGVVAAPGMPTAITSPVASVLPAMVPVPIETLVPPPPLGQSSQPSPVYGQVKQGQQQPENDELNTTLKEDTSLKPPLVSINPWMVPPNVSAEAKQINGLRIAPSFPPPNVRTSIADQMHSMTLTDESSHYHSSSSR